MRKRKPKTTIGSARVAKKANVGKREWTNIVDGANRWLGIATLVSRCWLLLKSLPWDEIHHLIR